MPAHKHPLRSWIVTLYRRGDLVSASEGAIVASVPRQTISRWLREERINTTSTRMQYLARVQTKMQLYLDGKPQQRRPSKTELRRQGAKALREWNRAAKQKRMAAAAG